MRVDLVDIGDGREAVVHAIDASEVKAIMDNCAAMRSAGAIGASDNRLAMSAPGWVILDWCNKKGLTWAKFMRDQKIQNRFLDDPDNSNFRIWTGKI